MSERRGLGDIYEDFYGNRPRRQEKEEDEMPSQAESGSSGEAGEPSKEEAKPSGVGKPDILTAPWEEGNLSPEQVLEGGDGGKLSDAQRLHEQFQKLQSVVGSVKDKIQKSLEAPRIPGTGQGPEKKGEKVRESDPLVGGDDLLPIGDILMPDGSVVKDPFARDDLPEDLAEKVRKIREDAMKDFGIVPESGKKEGGEQTAAAPAGEKKKEPERPAMEELDELIGLESIKKDVKELVDLVKTQTLREKEGLKTVPVSLHLVFSGNPGTGKTTVARILARLYHEIGALKTGQLVECDRSSLVAGFVGQTALKTQEKIQEAMGGILFIDEAYTLAKEGQDYGQEAIDTILKAMEDHRGEFVVIVAGYTELMKRFVESNPGLKSRFNKYIEFPDYTPEELMAIFEMQCRKYQYEMDEEASRLVRERIGQLSASKGENFANAREVRNLFERIITLAATRVARMEAPTEKDLCAILPEDVLAAGDQDLPEAAVASIQEALSLSGQEETGEEGAEEAAGEEED